MPQSERLLLGPGPSNPYPEAVAALTRPVLGHLDPEFLALLDETMDRLRTVFRTKNALTLPISGTGSAGMEACFVNLLEPGDTAIVGVNGVFGERMGEGARRCGAGGARPRRRGCWRSCTPRHPPAWRTTSHRSLRSAIPTRCCSSTR